MISSIEIRKRLGQLELEEYAGNLGAFSSEDKTIHEQLMRMPVEMRRIPLKKECDGSLVALCSELAGKYESLIDLRIKIIEAYTTRRKPLEKMQTLGAMQSPCLFAILVDGLYLGDPEDILNKRKQIANGSMTPPEIWYPIQGLGEKIAEIIFSEK